MPKDKEKKVPPPKPEPPPTKLVKNSENPTTKKKR
jgi:hypothetical protein